LHAKYKAPNACNGNRDMARANLVRLKTLEAKNAGALLKVMNPNPYNGCQLTSAEFTAFLNMRLGASGANGQANCAQCGLPLQPYPHHILRCSRGSEMSDVHNALRDCVAETARLAGITTRVEPRDLLLGTAESQRRPDLLLNNFGSSFGDCCVDVSVTSSLQKSIVNAGTVQPGRAARAVETEKNHKYRSSVVATGRSFVPLVVETFGVIGAEGHALLDRLSSRLAAQLDMPVRVASCIVFGKLSACLWRHQARMVLRRLPPAEAPDDAFVAERSRR